MNELIDTETNRITINTFLRILVLVSITVLTNSAFANIGETPSPRAGNLTGDSYLKKLTVIREDLTINLSEIHKGKPVKVWLDTLSIAHNY
jgi:hypothetical protein